MLAAGELVLLLERLIGPSAAISEAEQQAARWQSPVLQIQYVQLLGRHDVGPVLSHLRQAQQHGAFPRLVCDRRYRGRNLASKTGMLGA
jgi:hypothetical protein